MEYLGHRISPLQRTESSLEKKLHRVSLHSLREVIAPLRFSVLSTPEMSGPMLLFTSLIFTCLTNPAVQPPSRAH